ncbi:MAG TPA: polysaccharide biosynthesis tyrosine autokinase [Fimbriiglobus sp.]|jgi:capsular exopolysaccharide synthesis family protein|nr:polysaccharide biosynthesis tyrosine autokinase [Fimbriiglobus sp.]
MDPKAAQQAVGVATILSGLRRYLLLVAAAVVAAVCAAAAAWVLFPDPKMTGYVLFQLNSAEPNPIGDQPVSRDDVQLFRQEQAAIVKSRLVLNDTLSKSEAKEGTLKSLGSGDKIATLDKALVVDFRTGPDFMRVSMLGNDPGELRTIMDALSTSYLARVVENRKNDLRARIKKLEDLEEPLAKEIRDTTSEITKRLQRRPGQNGIDPLDGRREFKADLSRRKLEAQGILRELQAELAVLGSTPGAIDPQATSTALAQALASNQSYQTLRQQRDRLRTDIEEMRKRLAPGRKSPDLEALETQLKTAQTACENVEAQTRKEIEDNLRRTNEQALAVQKGRLQNSISQKESLITELEEELNNLTLKYQQEVAGVDDVDGLTRILSRDQGRLTQIQSRLESLRLEAGDPDRVTKLEHDVIPGAGGPKRLMFTGLAGLMVLGGGLAGLVLLDRRNPKVLTTHQLTSQFRLSVLGVVPAFRDGPRAITSGQPAVASDWQMAAMEAVCGTRTMLQYGVSQNLQQARTILVGSAVSGEGKTSLSLLLSRSLAQAGNRTLLIDGDLRRPNTHDSLGLTRGPGLCEYLTGKADLASICRPTDTPDLTVITGGSWSEAASQALAGPSLWPDLIRRMTVEYDYVLIDSSPLLPVTDALLMARAVDGVVLAVRQDVSEVNAIRDALAQLALIGARVLGVVVNGGPVRRYAQYPYRPSENEAPVAEVTDIR